LDKGPSLLHSPVPPPPFPSLNPHHDQLLMNRNNSLFHPLPLHALQGAPKPPSSASNGPPPMNFPSPFGPLPHDNLRHLDPLGLRLMNPAAAAAAAQLFAAQSPFSHNVNRPALPPGFDPTTAAFLLDPRYRSMMSPFGGSVPPPSPSSSTSNNSSSSNNPLSANNTHNHSHVHSHSHTHLHLNNNNDQSSPSNSSNGPAMPPSMLPFLIHFLVKLIENFVCFFFK